MKSMFMIWGIARSHPLLLRQTMDVFCWNSSGNFLIFSLVSRLQDRIFEVLYKTGPKRY